MGTIMGGLGAISTSSSSSSSSSSSCGSWKLERWGGLMTAAGSGWLTCRGGATWWPVAAATPRLLPPYGRGDSLTKFCLHRCSPVGHHKGHQLCVQLQRVRLRVPPLGVSLDEGEHHICVFPPDVVQVSVHCLGDAGAPQQPFSLLFMPEGIPTLFTLRSHLLNQHFSRTVS